MGTVNNAVDNGVSPPSPQAPLGSMHVKKAEAAGQSSRSPTMMSRVLSINLLLLSVLYGFRSWMVIIYETPNAI